MGMIVFHPASDRIVVEATYAELQMRFGLTFPIGTRTEDLQRHMRGFERLLVYALDGYVPLCDHELFLDSEKYIINAEWLPRSDTDIQVTIDAQCRTEDGEVQSVPRRRRVFEFAQFDDALDFCHAFQARLPNSVLLRYEDAYFLDFREDLPDDLFFHIFEYGDAPDSDDEEIRDLGKVVIETSACQKLSECFKASTHDEDFHQHIEVVGEWLLGDDSISGKGGGASL